MTRSFDVRITVDDDLVEIGDVTNQIMAYVYSAVEAVELNTAVTPPIEIDENRRKTWRTVTSCHPEIGYHSWTCRHS